jgi:hypothetical protein
MRFFIALAACCLIAFLAAPARAQSSATWQVLYAHDAEGNTIDGDKDQLIAHVRAGQPVRVGWAGGSVEHVAPAGLLTVFDGEVYAQLPGILAQAPDADREHLRLRDGETHWRAMISTRGTLESGLDGDTPVLRPMAARWFGAASPD